MTDNVLTALGGVSADVLLPSEVWLPFHLPAALRFAVPVAVSGRRQTEAARKRLLTDLGDGRPNVRRTAALDLAGWPATPQVESGLERLLADDPDRYVRAVVALTLAVHSDEQSAAIARAAEDVIGHAADADEQWAGIAASIALLALSIVAVRSSDVALRARAWLLAKALSAVPTERVRADALARVLEESRPDSVTQA